MKKSFEFKVAMTHSGVFHADDVFGAALCRILNPEIDIKRVRTVDSSVDESTIIFDIGFGKFDHHQKDVEVRDDGTKFAAFGLLWREFGNLLVSEENVKKFDSTFVELIDATDNGGSMNPMSMSVSAFVPNWDECTDMDTAFFEAVKLAETILTKHIKRMQSNERASSLVKAAYENSDGTVVVLDRFLPSINELIPTTALFVVFPSLRGGYNAQAIPSVPGGRDQKVPFPQEWRGLSPEILNEFAMGASFCHPAGFMLAADTVEHAVEACRKAIELNK